MENDTDYDMQSKILLWVLMDTGIRISEALSITESSFDGYGFCLLYTSPSPRDRG